MPSSSTASPASTASLLPVHPIGRGKIWQVQDMKVWQSADESLHCQCGGDRVQVCRHIRLWLVWDRLLAAPVTPSSLTSSPSLASPVPTAPHARRDADSPAWDPSSAQWGQPPLPKKFTQFRPFQRTAIAQILEAFDDPITKIVLVDAPTGSGKSLIAEAVRRRLGTRAWYVTPTKQLQDQILHDFSYAKVLKGRRNYPTHDHPELFTVSNWQDQLTANECTAVRTTIPACESCDPDWVEDDHVHCAWCHPVYACPYRRAKAEATAAQLGVVNLSYWLREVNGPGQTGGAGLVILDEADTLETALLDFVSVTLSAAKLKRLGIGMPEKKTVRASWVEWIQHTALPAIDQAIHQAQQQTTPQGIRDGQDWTDIRGKLHTVVDSVDDWVYTDYQENKVTFKPLTVNLLGPSLIWGHATRFLVLSASFVSGGQFCADTGIPAQVVRTVSIPSAFDPARHPTYIWPVATMSRKGQQDLATLPAMVSALQQILEAHAHDRILVHTVSWQLTQDLVAALHSSRLVVWTDRNRDQALATYLRTPGAVLLAPSFDRGVDLSGDACRVVVVCKMAYPSLGDKQVAGRLYRPGGDTWYAVQTIRTLVQQMGRGMRGEQDWMTGYVLDRQFLTLYQKHRHLFPKAFVETLQWESGVHPPDTTRIR